MMGAPRWRLLIVALLVSLVCGSGSACGPRKHDTVVCQDGTVAGGNSAGAREICGWHGGVAE